jgi:hypothetical protein
LPFKCNLQCYSAVFDPTQFAGGANANTRGGALQGGFVNAVPPAAAVAHKTFHRYVVGLCTLNQVDP